ncbi:TPA_asm: DUF1642 domain-containing protein [Listeria monocytogenes]|uniref:DUF1642 domain-containing protein n=1 Tax=Listeria monocytogenes TaxID=1639 RepID=UPI00175C6E1E|nr:DUF1642 domain-containing protein [Listeria monocytogenes]HAB7370930.1 DUF1642 domain-containing protein [Listeria monocytogenes]HAB8531045.1 DUF1642 domain-containing protein [Listeria monocytogenes]HAB8795742.1 DUF1642 domain-containing protein [Listeria monocytogenes]HAB9071133.1 DUF1642 domain-containing protein [Listeria monocytogenes]
MRFKEGDKVQFIENNELIIGTIKRVNNDVGWVDLKVSDLSWFFRKLEDVVKVKEPELIAVPRFAADWLNHCKQREYDLACLLDYGNAGIPDEMYEWLISSADNQGLLARAWLDGYEVEKEPLYYVKLPYFGYVTNRMDYTLSQSKTDAVMLNESKIKRMDERYWQFAVLVEEEEE